MTNAENSYKTQFESFLEFGLHAYELSLTNSKPQKGAILIELYVPLLIAHTEYSKGQFRIIRERQIKEERFILMHLLAVQGINSSTIAEEIQRKGELYEILSIWIPPSNDFRALPNFELTACVNNWYLDSLEDQKGKQRYDPRKMTGRTLNALQLHKKIDLPNQRIAGLIEID